MFRLFLFTENVSPYSFVLLPFRIQLWENVVITVSRKESDQIKPNVVRCNFICGIMFPTGGTYEDTIAENLQTFRKALRVQAEKTHLKQRNH